MCVEAIQGSRVQLDCSMVRLRKIVGRTNAPNRFATRGKKKKTIFTTPTISFLYLCAGVTTSNKKYYFIKMYI